MFFIVYDGLLMSFFAFVFYFGLYFFFLFTLAQIKRKKKYPKERKISAIIQNLYGFQCTKLLVITTFLSMLYQIIAPQKQVVHFATLSFTIVFATSAFRYASAYAKSDNSRTSLSSFAALMRFMRIQASGLLIMIKNQNK